MTVYLMYQEDSDLFKIGVSKHSKKRLKENQTGNGNKLQLIHCVPCRYPYVVESTLHNRFQHKRKEGEWFEFDNYDIKDFVKMCKEIDNNLKFLEDNNTWVQKVNRFS